jgi:hypothetical protein
MIFREATLSNPACSLTSHVALARVAFRYCHTLSISRPSLEALHSVSRSTGNLFENECLQMHTRSTVPAKSSRMPCLTSSTDRVSEESGQRSSLGMQPSPRSHARHHISRHLVTWSVSHGPCPKMGDHGSREPWVTWSHGSCPKMGDHGSREPWVTWSVSHGSCPKMGVSLDPRGHVAPSVAADRPTGRRERRP